jgi:hypothetical protein
MNGNKILQQISAIFSIFMVMFYIGVGSFFVFYFDERYLIAKPTRMIIGSAFLLYGTYRAFRSFVQIKEIFFSKEDDNNE